MANFTGMTTAVQGLVGNHTLATTAQVGTFINRRHALLMEAHEWSRKKQEILVPTAADKTGTIDVTNASSTFSNASITIATTDSGRYIQVGTEMFVSTYVSASSLTIGDLNGTAVLFPGTTATGQSFVMFTRWYSLTAGVEQILSVSYERPITEVSQEWIDWKDPERDATATYPYHFARGPRNISGANDIVRVEFWPRPSSPITIRVAVQVGHTDLSGTQNPIVPSGPLEWWAAVDTCYFLHARQNEAKWLRLASEYQKEAIKLEEDAKNQDAKKFGTIKQVQDAMGGVGLGGTDFALDHDTGVN